MLLKNVLESVSSQMKNNELKIKSTDINHRLTKFESFIWKLSIDDESTNTSEQPFEKYLTHFTYQTHSYVLAFISILFISLIIVQLIHIYHIWLSSYDIVFQYHCLFSFFNLPSLWKIRDSLGKLLTWNTYCITRNNLQESQNYVQVISYRN